MNIRTFFVSTILVICFAPTGFGEPLQQAKLSGTATYRERMALPPNAVFEAILEDVSRPGAIAQEIGRVRIEKPGLPPFRFSIPYDSARIKSGGMYSVRALVLVDGKLWFQGAQPYAGPGPRGSSLDIIMQ